MPDKPAHTLDLRHMQCPFTIMELGKSLEKASSGDLIEVLLDGRSAFDEIGLWCLKTGNVLEETPEAGASEGGEYRTYVRKP